ncbi:MAG: hypothetical protein WBD07_02255 [Vicinamibacterales bacterium]
MPTRTLLAVAVLLGALLPPCAAAGQGQAQAPWFGTWKLDLMKSAYDPGPPPFRRATLKVEPSTRQSSDGVNVTYDMIRPRGGITHLEWTGRFDGKDYPLQGIEDYAVTIAYHQLDSRTFDVVQKVDGAPVVTARMTISADGQTLTLASPGSTAVYDLSR